MANCESPNGQNDPRSINMIYTDKEQPKMTKKGPEWTKITQNGPKWQFFRSKMVKMIFKKNSSPVSNMFSNFYFMAQVIKATQIT